MRINSIVLLATTCSIWSGCGDEDSKNKGSAAGNIKSGKTAPAAGNVVKPNLTGKAVIQNHGGPKPNNTPPPSPPALREESNLEKILKIRDDCLKKFEPMETVKNVEPEKVYETQVKLSLEYQDCLFKMSQLTTDNDSGLAMVFGKIKLSHQLEENLSLLHATREKIPTRYLDELIAGGETLHARLVAGTKKEITLTQAEKDLLGKVFATIVVIADDDVKGRFPMGDSKEKIQPLKVKLEKELERNFEEKVRLKLLYKKIEIVLKYLDAADFLYLNQKSSVRNKIGEFVRKSLFHHQNNVQVSFFVHLTFNQALTILAGTFVGGTFQKFRYQISFLFINMGKFPRLQLICSQDSSRNSLNLRMTNPML